MHAPFLAIKKNKLIIPREDCTASAACATQKRIVHITGGIALDMPRFMCKQVVVVVVVLVIATNARVLFAWSSKSLTQKQNKTRADILTGTPLLGLEERTW